VGVSVVVLAALGLFALWIYKRKPAGPSGAMNPLVQKCGAEVKNDAIELHSYSHPSEVLGFRDTVGELDERNYQ
jgi:hypothetical protein